MKNKKTNKTAADNKKDARYIVQRYTEPKDIWMDCYICENLERAKWELKFVHALRLKSKYRIVRRIDKVVVE